MNEWLTQKWMLRDAINRYSSRATLGAVPWVRRGFLVGMSCILPWLSSAGQQIELHPYSGFFLSEPNQWSQSRFTFGCALTDILVNKLGLDRQSFKLVQEFSLLHHQWQIWLCLSSADRGPQQPPCKCHNLVSKRQGGASREMLLHEKEERILGKCFVEWLILTLLLCISCTAKKS